MFEKDAEEWRNSLNYEIDNDTFNNIVIPCIEFGYNKANEWHYVKDGDLPKNNTQVLVFLENKRMKISIFMENKFTLWNKDYNTYTKLYDVIAWKEIVLPELKESE